MVDSILAKFELSPDTRQSAARSDNVFRRHVIDGRWKTFVTMRGETAGVSGKVQTWRDGIDHGVVPRRDR